jgi:hypothetical protein
LLQEVLGLELPKLVDLKDKFQTTLEREMDNLKLVKHEDPLDNYGLHWEFQTNDADLCSRNLLYFALFLDRHKLPLKQFVIYLGDDPPKKILNNEYDFDNLKYNFEVIIFKQLPKDLFLQAKPPEVVILAILADFGKDQPEKVVRQILQNLQKIVGKVPRLKKYQQQLQVLSRLRKLSGITKIEIEAMPFHYEIETDALYLEGIEKGIEKGIETNKSSAVKRMLQQKKYTIKEIMLILEVDEPFVRKIALEIGIDL